MSKFVLISSLLISSTVYAKIDKSLCDTGDDQVTKRVNVDGTPNYFFKTSPDGRYLYYITGNRNFVHDSKTGKRRLLPGNADPVPSSDGKFYTAINWRSGNPSALPDWSMTVGAMENWDVIRNRDGSPKRDEYRVDKDTTRTYQSVGTLGNNTYRVISFNDRDKTLLLKDFKLNGRAVSRVEKYDTVIPLKDYRLPMISRDGKYFSALDVEKNQTVIFEISADGKKVKETDRLDFPSGKADFSMDGKKVAFHVTESVNNYVRISDEVSLPATFNDQAEVRNVFVYDRETKSVTPVTQNKVGNSYFPVFLEDGSLVYLDQRPGQKLGFAYAKIPDTAPRSLERARDCYEGESFDKTLDFLAAEWRRVCTNWHGSGKGGDKAMSLNMPIELCHQIAEKSKIADVKKMCDALKKSELKKPVVAVKSRAQQILQVKCAICHGDNIPFGDKTKLKDYKKSILDRINHSDPNKRMPLGGSLSDNDKAELEKYIGSL